MYAGRESQVASVAKSNLTRYGRLLMEHAMLLQDMSLYLYLDRTKQHDLQDSDQEDRADSNLSSEWKV